MEDWWVEESPRRIEKTGRWRKVQGGLIFWRLEDSPRRIDRLEGGG